MILSESLDAVLAWLEERKKSPGDLWGLSTGFESWDNLTGGLHPGEVTIVGARTSVGKTTLALQIAWNVVRQGYRVMIVSPEMGERQVTLRLLALVSGVSVRSMVTGTLTSGEEEQIESAASVLRSVGDRCILHCQAIDLVSLETKVEEQVLVGGLGLLVIDYLQLIQHQAFTPYERATEVSRRIRSLANRVQVPVLLLSQLRRPEGGKDEPPTLHDLRDSGNIEQDADNVILLWRQQEEDRRSNIARVDLAKQRNGPTGSFRLLFVPETFRFIDIGR